MYWTTSGHHPSEKGKDRCVKLVSLNTPVCQSSTLKNNLHTTLLQPKLRVRCERIGGSSWRSVGAVKKVEEVGEARVEQQERITVEQSL